MISKSMVEWLIEFIEEHQFDFDSGDNGGGGRATLYCTKCRVIRSGMYVDSEHAAPVEHAPDCEVLFMLKQLKQEAEKS